MIAAVLSRYTQAVRFNIIRMNAGLDIGYVPAGPHAFLRLSGLSSGHHNLFSTGPRVLIFFFFFSASYSAIIFTGNRQNSEDNINSYFFFVIYRPTTSNVQKYVTSSVKS